MASPTKLSIHSKAYVPSSERGFFDGLVHTFVHEHRHEATALPDSFHNVVALAPTDITPVPVVSNVNCSAIVAEHCQADLRALTVQKYNGHFTALLEAEIEEALQAAVDGDIMDHQFSEADSRLEQSGDNRKTGMLLTMRLPHLQEGIPHLEIGSLVRMRPQPLPAAPGTQSKCEIEAVVENVAPTRGVVVIRVPPRCVSRVCMVCLEEYRTAQAMNTFAPSFGSLPTLRPATHWLEPCMHQVICEAHALAGKTATGHCRCPFCLRDGLAVEVGACPSMPAHLQWTKQQILAGRGERIKCGSLSLPGFIDIKMKHSHAQSWHSVFRRGGQKTIGYWWRVRFQETAIRPMLEATHRLRTNCSWSLYDTPVPRLTYLQTVLSGPCLELARCLFFMASNDMSVMTANPSHHVQLLATAANLTVLLTNATESGEDSRILEGAFCACVHLPVGAIPTFQYIRATSLLSAIYASIDMEQRLFPSLPGLFSFPPEQALIEATTPGRCPLDLVIVATVMLHVHKGMHLQRLQLDDLIRISSPTQLTGLAENLVLKIVNGLSVRQRAMLDAVVYNNALASFMCVSPEQGVVLLPEERMLADAITMKSWQLLAQPVIHFFDDRLNEQQQAAVQAVISGAHGRVPYLLVGPAGCGKTSVDVEILMQLLTRAAMDYPARGPHHPAFGRILLVAPSDEAVDLVLQRFVSLHEGVLGEAGVVSLDTGAAAPLSVPEAKGIRPGGIVWKTADNRELTAAEKSLQVHRHGMPLLHDAEGLNILRLCAPTRPFDTFAGKKDLYKYALVQTEEGVQRFVVPDVRVLARSAMIACTARVAAILPSLGLGKGSFSHIVYDEASQSMEPEAMSALLLAGPLTRIVLSGDPRQLGPNVRSSHAHEHGLGVSVQERLGQGRQVDGAQTTRTLVSKGISSAGLSHVTAHMAENLFRGRQPSVYTRYKEDLFSGTWLARRGIHKWPAQRGPVSVTDATDGSGATAAPVHPSSGFLPPLNHMLEVALSVNYRSHQALCDLPSRLFYQDAPIISNADPSRISSALGFSLLARKAGSPFPLLAIGVDGVEAEPNIDSTQEAAEGTRQGKSLVPIDSGQSYINEAECDAAAWVIQSLLSESQHPPCSPPEPRALYHSGNGMTQEYPGTSTASHPFKITQADIAVICPFRRQVLKMRDVLRKAGLNEVNVGQPQNLQGADKPVVIVCTVLAKRFGKELLSYYKRKQRGSPLGLLLNDKSFCVSITRPESLLIAIGHPDTWAEEWRREGNEYKPGNWAVLLETAVEVGAFIGFGPRVSETNNWAALTLPIPPSRRALHGTQGRPQATGQAALAPLFPRQAPNGGPRTLESEVAGLTERMLGNLL